MLCVVHLLTAEAVHGLEVVAEFLILKGWNSHLSQIYDQVGANYLVVFDVSFMFGNLV